MASVADGAFDLVKKSKENDFMCFNNNADLCAKIER